MPTPNSSAEKELQKFSGFFPSLPFSHIITVPIGYSNLGYSGRAAYSDLNPNGTWSSCITIT